MAKKILEDNEILVAAAAKPEVLAGAEEAQSEPEVVQIETPVVEPKQEVLAGEDESTQTSTLPPDESKVNVPSKPDIIPEPDIPDTSSIEYPTTSSIAIIPGGNNFDEAEQQRLRLLGYI